MVRQGVDLIDMLPALPKFDLSHGIGCDAELSGNRGIGIRAGSNRLDILNRQGGPVMLFAATDATFASSILRIVGSCAQK